MEHIERMLRIREEVWIVRSGLVVRRVPVELSKRRCTCAVVIYHVDDHRNTSLVALVNELLVLFTCTICLVKSKVVSRIVTPALVSVKLLDRHKLNCIDAESLEIVQLLHGTCYVVSLRKVSEKHLVDYRAFLVLHRERSPRIIVPVDLHT